MLAQHYLRYRDDLAAQGIIFAFTGYVSERILYSLGEALKQKMALDDTDNNVIKRVFSVFVEQVQNIIRYSADRVGGSPGEPGTELSSGMVLVGMEGERFFVVCGNVINRDDVPRLQSHLEHLAGMDHEALKAYYKQQLRAPSEEDSKGANLGLIEIARRASEPVEFDFTEVGDEQSFFCLKAYI